MHMHMHGFDTQGKLGLEIFQPKQAKVATYTKVMSGMPIPRKATNRNHSEHMHRNQSDHPNSSERFLNVTHPSKSAKRKIAPDP